MRQGTTPKHTFSIPFDTSNVGKVRVYYAQKDSRSGETVRKITKTESDVAMEGNTISLRLSQEDTLLLEGNKVTLIQLRVVTKAEESFVSDIVTVMTEQCLSDEVV
jgi:hypothetical protein